MKHKHYPRINDVANPVHEYSLAMFKLNASSFLESFRPVYLVTKNLHIHFETINFRLQTVERTLLDQFRFILSVALDGYLVSVGCRNSSGYLQLTDSMLINSGCYVSVVSLYLFSFSLPLWNRYKAAEMFEVFRTISDCDRNLEVLGAIVDHRKHLVTNTVSLGTVVMFILAILGIGGYIRFTVYWKHFEPILPDDASTVAVLRTFITLHFFVCYCSLILWSIRERFLILQQVIVRLSKAEAAQPLIQIIAEVHDQLCDTVLLFNRCYSGHIMYLMVVAFTYSIFCVFGLIHSYASNANAITMRVSWNNMIYDMGYLQIILQPIVLSSLVYRACRRTSILISKDICYRPYEKRTMKELRIIFQQMYHRKAKIGNEVVELDWVLLYTMAGSFTTYLVILLQFDLANFNGL
uniref:gustatory receptor 21 n=1 Tax=Aedes aegypti TaxID=7159 RepID=UPI000C2F815A|nr:gustatory receptor 21 [Aedes aegypti]